MVVLKILQFILISDLQKYFTKTYWKKVRTAKTVFLETYFIKTFFGIIFFRVFLECSFRDIIIIKFWTFNTHCDVIAELGNCTFSPHFRNIIDIRSDCGRADKKMWRICSCGPSATLKRIRIQVLGAASLI
jgi:hypothetical protein